MTVPRPTGGTLLSLRLFGRLAESHLPKHPNLGLRLEKSRSPLVPVAFLAGVYGHVALAILGGAVPAIAYLAVVGPGGLNAGLIVPLVALPGLLAVITYSYALLKPELQIGARRRNLDANLPYALNFMAALASAGVVPIEVFGALGQQAVYGEAAKEAAWIYRDAKIFSKDLVGALQAAARRSPSQLFEEFLQGAVNTITSGGDLKSYLMAKSEQYQQENRRKLKGFLESLGVMAESYVVVAAAAPLFLIVIFSVMMLLSKGADPTLFLNILILVALPVLHGIFTYILRTMRPD